MSRHRGWGQAIFALVVTVAACGQQTTEGTTTTTGESQANEARAGTTTAVAEVDRQDLEDGLPRVGSYGFVDMTITAATLGHIEPNTFLRDEQAVSGTNHVFLTMEVANVSEKGDAANWPPTPYGLRVAGESAGPPQMLEGRPHIGLPALSSADVTMAFEVPEETKFADLELVVAEEDRIPLVIPLVGALPAPFGQVVVEAIGEGPARGAASGCNQQLEVEFLESTVSIDLLESESYPTAYGSRRAAVGDRFLTVETRVLNLGGSRCGAGGTNIDGSLVRLYVDDVPRAPIAWVNTTIAINEAKDLIWHFNYPVDADRLQILFGSEEAEPLWVPVDVSAVEGP